jgi:transcription initiation factor TFIIIB Brf1 subunit/transcription initiation factor TFIIB
MSIDSVDACPSCGGFTTYDTEEEATHCRDCGLSIDDYVGEFEDDERTDVIDEYDFIAEAD